MSIVVAGEALVDLVGSDDGYRPVTGGSPFNVAIGLCRLGTTTHLLSRISSDRFGRRLLRTLRDEGANLDLIVPTTDPTTLAIVHLDETRDAGYEFYLSGTSAMGLQAPLLPELPLDASLHVSLGAIALDSPTSGPALRALMTREHGRRIVSFDPNIRPAAIGNLTAYAARLDAIVNDVDVVRVSEQDLRHLAPARDPLDVAAGWAGRTAGRRSPGLVVVTRGADGAVAIRGRERVEVAGDEVEVVDTIGAGDSFTAAFLHWLETHGHGRGTKDLEQLRHDDLQRALRFSCRAAAMTCTRTGADPPRTGEM
ncbi:MAG: carbohydrate kinase [Nitriliruptoraceae bacterium]